MKRTSTLLLGIIAGLTLAAGPARATLVQLELYNTYNLVDFTSAPLAQGDYVQIILGTITAPNPDGSPIGSVLSLTSVGYGTGIDGYLDYWPVEYDSSQVGQNFYVRFWNGVSPVSSTYYGNSAQFTLPAGDGGGQALLDFTPAGAGSPHQTTQLFTAIPEPSSLFIFGLGFMSVWWLKKKTKTNALT